MLHQARLTLLAVVATALTAGAALAEATPPTPARPAPPVPEAPPTALPAPAAPAVKAAVKAPVARVTLSPVTDKDFRSKVLGVGGGKGRPVLVSFWASYCAPCLSELPALLKLKKAAQKRGGDIVFVNVDPPGDPAQIQKVAALKNLPAFESFQVMNEDPQPFIDAVDKKWMGEVPYAAVFASDGTLKKGLSGEQTAVELQMALDEVL